MVLSENFVLGGFTGMVIWSFLFLGYDTLQLADATALNKVLCKRLGEPEYVYFEEDLESLPDN
jgi:hypothetical protein